MSAPANGGRVYATVAELLAAQRSGLAPTPSTRAISHTPAPPSHTRGSQKRARPAGACESIGTSEPASMRGDGRTLYFGSVPPSLFEESALRAALLAAGVAAGAVAAVQIRRGRGGRRAGRGATGRAWASYADRGAAAAALRAINGCAALGMLRARVHTPPTDGAARPGDAFERRADLVVANGGLANTLMLRNAPVELQPPELHTVLTDRGAQPLRVRTALSRAGAARNFWLVYETRDACRSARDRVDGACVQLRCGKMLRFAPVVHDDSQDAESRKRRRREIAMGAQPSVGDVCAGIGGRVSARDALERFLRREPALCMFLKVDGRGE